VRAIEEWIGKSDDSAIPPRVKVRVFEQYNGVCYLSGVKIRPGDKWEIEHVKALCNGGEHRESNMAPALVAPHKVKTKSDRREKAKNDRIRKRHIGIKKPRSILGWRKFNGEVVRASRVRS
jgi:5-methylcytosine-specific restriction endonuclease McrA